MPDQAAALGGRCGSEPAQTAKALKMRHKVRHFVRSLRGSCSFNRLSLWFFRNLSAFCQVLLAIWTDSAAYLSFRFQSHGVTFEAKRGRERPVWPLFCWLLVVYCHKDSFFSPYDSRK